jgi:hypothetical protein
MSPPKKGTLIGGRYLIEEMLGRGGSGAVLRVCDRRTGEPLALKYHQLVGWDGVGWSWRMRREFYLMSHLRHPNIVRVRDWGEEASALYFTMDLISGHDVSDLAPLSPAALAELLVAMGSALGLIHGRGFVHHDIKPRNVRVPVADVPSSAPAGTAGAAGADDLRRAVLMDFGLLSQIGTTLDEEGLAGTPGYVAPERLLGAPAAVTDDLYALGATAYRLLTGVKPPLGGFDAEPPLPEEVPPTLARLVGDLLARDVARRLPDVAELLERLAVFTDVRPAMESAAPSYLVTPPLVGRDREMAALRAAWGEAAAGQGGALYVVAQPGMGKTHLLRSLALELRVAGAVVAETAGEAQVRAPFAVLGRLLGQLFGDWTHAARAGTDEPGLLSQLLDGRVQGSAPGDEQARVARAVGGWLRAAGRGRPIVLFVDDLQWCDDASAQVLEALTRTAHDHALLVVAAVRVESDPATWAARLACGSRGAVVLQPFDLDATTALLQRLFGRVDAPASMVTQLHQAAAGHPYLLVELARALVDRGLAVFEGGRWQLPRQVDDLTLPATLEEALESRVLRLSVGGRRVARALAAAGGAASHALLAEVTGLDQQELVAIEEDLVERQVLVTGALAARGAGGGGGRAVEVRFVHPRLQEVVYAALDAPSRQDWHRRIATALRRRVSDRGGRGEATEMARRLADAGELGHHLARGGDDLGAEAVKWLLVAGDGAYDRGHYADALEPMREAVAILERRGGPEMQPDLVRLWQCIALATATTDVHRSQDILVRLIDHLDRGGAMARVRARAERVGPRLAAVGSMMELAVRRLAEGGLGGLGRAFGEAEGYLLARLYQAIGRSLIGELAQGYETLAVLEPFAKAIGGDALVAPMLARAGLGISDGQLEKARRLSLRCIELLQGPRRVVPELERRRILSHAYLALSWVVALRGVPDSEGVFARFRQVAEDHGDDVARLHATAVPAVHHARRGEIRPMLAAREVFFSHCHKVGGGWHECLVLPTTTRALIDAGLLARAREDIHLFRLLCAPGPFRDVWLDLLEGSHLVASGDPQAGRERLDAAAHMADEWRVRSPLWASQARCFGAEAELAALRPEHAMERARAAVVQAESVEYPWVAGRARRVMARAALTIGEVEQARYHLDRATVDAAALESPGEVAQVDLLAAELELASGREPAAHAAARRAEQTFVALGNGLLARRAAELGPTRTLTDPVLPMLADVDTLVDERSSMLTLARGR